MRGRLEARLALVCLVYAAAAAACFPASYAVLFREYARTHFLVLPPLLFFGLVAAAVVARPAAPLRWLGALLLRRGPGAAATIAVFCVAIAGFSTFKHQFPRLVPFFADASLADLDAALHGGPPWAVAHAVLPAWAEPALFYLYGPVWFFLWLGLLLVAAFLTCDGLRRRYLVAFAATLVLLGTVGMVAGASAGPILYDRMAGSARFAELTAALGARPYGAVMLRASDYLYAAYSSDDAVFGTGISAMPSIHVAMAALNALFLGRLRWWLGAAGWLFAALILFGSVYFGWHYALDGYVALAGVLAIWRLAAAPSSAVSPEPEPATAAS